MSDEERERILADEKRKAREREEAITLRLQDEQKTHYQPNGRTTVCGAVARHMERLGGSPVGVLKIKKTTDVSQVDCPGCMGYLFAVVRRFKNPEDD